MLKQVPKMPNSKAKEIYVSCMVFSQQIDVKSSFLVLRTAPIKEGIKTRKAVKCKIPPTFLPYVVLVVKSNNKCVSKSKQIPKARNFNASVLEASSCVRHGI